MRARRCIATFLWFCIAASCARAQNAPSVALPPPELGANAEFLKAADEVLVDMSKLLALPVKEPLKRSVRTKEEIRAYLVRSMHEEQDSAKLHADVRTLELLGLLPKDYPLEQKMLDLLTEQIAGVYDPKGKEFFIAASTEPSELRVVMAHELTHALQDQSFHIDQWTRAVKGHDDAQFARDAVLEGSAMVAMIDYLMRGSGTTFRDLGSFDPALMMGDVDGSQGMKDVPLVLKDQLLFPYLSGAAFSVKVLTAAGGWTGLHTIFEKPPASTQQIMHPDLYLRGVQPEIVELPRMNGIVPRAWKKIDENVIGEFGMNQIFKQFLGKARADELASTWAGDRYAVYEQSPEGRAMLVIRIRLGGEAQAAQFFAGYRELLEKKYANPASVVSQLNSRFLETPTGGAFIRCSARDCLLGEGATRAQFDAMTRSIGWPAARTVAVLTPSLPLRPQGILALAAAQPREPLSQGLSARKLSRMKPFAEWLNLPRVPEPEVMDDSGEVEAYSSAAAQAYLNKIDDTFVHHAASLVRSGVSRGEAGRALDIGSGPGQIVLKLAQQLPGWQFDGLDRSPNMMRHAQAALDAAAHQTRKNLAGRVQFSVADGCQLPFADATFDLVTCNSVLHHLAQPSRLFAEIARVASPIGAILVRDLQRPTRVEYPLHVRWHGRHYSGLMYKLYCDSVRAAYTPQELTAVLRASPLQDARLFTRGRTHLGFERPARLR